MPVVRSYVVRIYRSSREGITGMVEDVKTGRSRPFSSINELWRGLRQRPVRPAAPDNSELPPATQPESSQAASD